MSSRWFKAVAATSRANVSLYLIDPAGLTGGRYDDAIAFAQETGGDAFVNTNVFDRAVDRIWQESGTYYLLGYEPTNPPKSVHSIRVRVSRPGVQVRARRSRG